MMPGTGALVAALQVASEASPVTELEDSNSGAE